MCILASITAALLCWPLLAVLALRRTDRLASHPVLFAKTSHLFLDEYLANASPPSRQLQWTCRPVAWGAMGCCPLRARHVILLAYQNIGGLVQPLCTGVRGFNGAYRPHLGLVPGQDRIWLVLGASQLRRTQNEKSICSHSYTPHCQVFGAHRPVCRNAFEPDQPDRASVKRKRPVLGSCLSQLPGTVLCGQL